jgi:hypothetical protein
MLMLFPMTLLLLFRGQSAGAVVQQVNSLDGRVGLRPKLDGHTGQRAYLDGKAAVKPSQDGNTGQRG